MASNLNELIEQMNHLGLRGCYYRARCYYRII